MRDKELEEYINKIEPNFDSHLEKGTIEMSNEYYNLLEEKMARLINKNQELESQLDFIGEQNKYIDKLEKKVKELKKQYCERTDCSGRICNSKQYDSLVQRIENQQKEFIECLEKEIVDSKAGSSQQYYAQQHLRLYKEITGKED